VLEEIRWLRRHLGSGETRERLPLRVQESIRTQQESSEILIGWVQLAIVLTFGVLYTLAPKTFSDDAPFTPVPYALTAYLVFTGVRILLAHARRLPHGFLFLSVVFDIGLLYGLIFSFHIQYEQPASFYLKVPTLLYVFIFIVLRALRFEAGYVVFAGLVAAAGWLVMVWYATHVDPFDPMITKNYVEYLTSNSVLLGAEFDKVISILMVTFILALALVRAQRLLVAATVEESRARELSRFVPSEVARGVAGAEEGARAGAGEEGEATILFIDLEAFTSLSEGLEPTDVIDTLNDFFGAVSEPLARYGGVITQFQGDAILASFNVPKPDPGHARHAVLAALEMQALVANRRFGKGIGLNARVGINTGPVVGGLVGTPERLSYTVHGDAVNLAARLETLNKEYGTRILVSESTRQAAGPDAFPYEARGRVTVRGKHEPVTLYAIPVDPQILEQPSPPEDDAATTPGRAAALAAGLTMEDPRSRGTSIEEEKPE